MTKANVTNFSNEDELHWKMTANGRLTQISQVKQPLGRSSLNLFDQTKLTNGSNEDNLKWKRTLDGILPQISKVKYLSNNWSDLPQILNLSLCDQSKLYKCVK